MKPEIFKKYPLVKKHFDQEKKMFGPSEPQLRQQQERAIELIDAEGAGTREEKETAMICAALMLNPVALYVDVGRFWEGYTEEICNMVQGMLAIAPGSFLPAAIAQGTAASGIAQMEVVATQIKRDTLSAPADKTLEGVKAAYGQDMETFAYLDAPELLARYEQTREAVFAALEAKITPAEEPPPGKPRPSKPGNGSFEF